MYWLFEFKKIVSLYLPSTISPNWGENTTNTREKNKSWTEESLKRAIEMVHSSNCRIRSVAKDFHMSFSALQKTLRRDSGADTYVKTSQGRHNNLSDADEEAFADILISSARANFGFSLSLYPIPLNW